MRNVFLSVLAGLAAFSIAFQIAPAFGRDQFKKAFDNKYVKSEPATDTEKQWAALVKKTNCNICHVGTNRKMRNEYGQELNKLINTRDVTNVEKISKALDTVAKMNSNPKDPKSPTYEELIAKGKLPCENPPTATASAAAAGN